MTSKESLTHVLTVIDGETEELVDLLEIHPFDVTDFQRQFDVDAATDPQMLDRYSVGPDDISFLESKLSRKLDLDFQKFAYFIEAARRQ